MLRHAGVLLFAFGITGFAIGCSGSGDAELERTKAELERTKAELATAKNEQAKSEPKADEPRSKTDDQTPAGETKPSKANTPSEPRPWADVPKATLRLTATKEQHEKIPKDRWDKEEWNNFRKRMDEAVLATVQGKPGMLDFVEKNTLAITGRVEGKDEFDTIALSIVLVRDFDKFWFADDEEVVEKQITGLTFPNKYSHFVYDFMLTGKQTKDKKIEGTLSGTFRDLGQDPSSPRSMFVFSNLNFKEVPFTITQQ